MLTLENLTPKIICNSGRVKESLDAGVFSVRPAGWLCCSLQEKYVLLQVNSQTIQSSESAGPAAVFTLSRRLLKIGVLAAEPKSAAGHKLSLRERNVESNFSKTTPQWGLVNDTN